MFGVKMAKSLLKKVKKGAKKTLKKTVVFEEKVEKVASSATSSARSHVESLAHSRRDAAIVWGMIKNGSHSDAEIKEICKSKGFDTLLSEI
jgi:imidazole glycerol phosphate synthase subunit HisF